MSAGMVEVQAEEFQQDLTRYLRSETPLAIVEQGRMMWYYIPSQTDQTEGDDRLVQVVTRLEQLLKEHGISEEEVLGEFRARRARG
jgi:hypothetical protein